jgi:hypothetical protein
MIKQIIRYSRILGINGLAAIYFTNKYQDAKIIAIEPE